MTPLQRNVYYFEYEFALERGLKVSGFYWNFFFNVTYLGWYSCCAIYITSFSPIMVSLALLSDIKTLSFVTSTKSLPKSFSIIKICNSSLEEKIHSYHTHSKCLGNNSKHWLWCVVSSVENIKQMYEYITLS